MRKAIVVILAVSLYGCASYQETVRELASKPRPVSTKCVTVGKEGDGGPYPQLICRQTGG